MASLAPARAGIGWAEAEAGKFYITFEILKKGHSLVKTNQLRWNF